MASLGLALAAGADYDAAIRLANVAGGLEVEKIGVATVTRDEILATCCTPRSARRARAGREQGARRCRTLLAELDRRRRPGSGSLHQRLLRRAARRTRAVPARGAAQADCLVVGLNSDASVRQLEGPTRPLNPVEARALVLAGLQDVDFVTIFDDATPLALIEAIRPDVLVKGADYRKEEVVGADFVESLRRPRPPGRAARRVLDDDPDRSG